MGKISRGFLGGFQGQLGTAYGCFWRLMDLIKAMPRKVKRAATEGQLKTRLRLSLMTHLLSGISKIIEVGFQSLAIAGKSAMNAAVSYNINTAIIGVSPDFSVDFSKILISKGKLAEPAELDLAMEQPGKVKFSWEVNPDMQEEDGKPTDTAVFVLYNPVKDKYVKIRSTVLRSALSYVMSVPSDFSGDTVQCYMFFVGTDGKTVSTSVYRGGLEVL